MSRALRMATLAVLSVAISAVGGCITPVSPEEFLAKYTTNIEVPNPASSDLPCRTFLGEIDGQYHVKDVIPFSQGGGFLGKTVYWACSVPSLPQGFMRTYRPGDLVFDGRPGSKYTYLIQWFGANTGGAAAPAPGP